MKSIAVVFGGRSSEHDVSCISVQTIIKNIDTNEYKVYLVGITKEGKWLLADSLESIEDGSWRDSKISAVISPDREIHGLIIDDGNSQRKEYIDVVFPVLHGLNGEDGTVQGLFELSGIPYVGCGVLSSAVSMDKFFTKIIVDDLDIRQAKFVPVYSEDLCQMDEVLVRVESKLSYPVFVKPSNAGSSQGVSKAHDKNELIEALLLAAKHDRKILVEETIVGREIECAVYGAYDKIEAFEVGEVVAADEFYSYDAKYNNEASKTVIKPELPAGKSDEVKAAAKAIFKAVDGFGLSRVDFFLENGSNDIVFNEINTLPGFTSISMYPMLARSAGVETKDLVNNLINMATERR